MCDSELNQPSGSVRWVHNGNKVHELEIDDKSTGINAMRVVAGRWSPRNGRTFKDFDTYEWDLLSEMSHNMAVEDKDSPLFDPHNKNL